ncbi:hypothetical protein [Actinomadura violacea]|uniref:hypothetical protein n=1 Tax=Actinomadura violacea TaxID=2819934 RepID=UPI001E4FA6A8|nr:hypothetical protein [Actinomadura violacea]
MTAMHLPTYLTMLAAAERTLAASHLRVAGGHTDEPDVRYTCTGFAAQSTRNADALDPIAERYAGRRQAEPDRLHPRGLTAVRPGPVGLLRDLQDLYQLAGLVEITWTLVGQAAAGARDRELIGVAGASGPRIGAQLAWLRMRMKAAAPQTLLVAP